jgi:RNA polymerase sigma factor (sigma-70 family)
MPRPTRTLARFVRLAAEQPSDASLVERYVQGDVAALEAIVRRHGPTVLGVCRRVLGTCADADDAFQATFLSLTLQARSIRNPAVLNAWLHGVALRCCRKAIGRRTPMPVRELASRSDPFAEVSWRELRVLLDEELNRLPTQLRAPLILCHLENRTRDEAARSLGWSLRTFDRRLARGRELLKARLVRRGVGTLGLGLTVLGGEGLTAAVPERLVGAICDAKAIVSPAVRSLLAPASTGSTFKLAISVLLVLCGLAAVSGFGGSPRTEKTPDSPKPKMEVVDDLEEPMPEGALRRFGSTRFRYPGGSAHAAMSRDGKMIAIGGYGVVLVYDTATGKRIRTLDMCGMTNAVGRLPAMAFSPDGKLLAHIVRDGEIAARVWSLETGKEIASVKGLRPNIEFSTGYGGFGRAETEYDNYTGILFTGDGLRIALVGDRRIQVRDARTGESVANYEVPAIEVVNAGESETPKTDPPAAESAPRADRRVGTTRLVYATMMAFSPHGKFYVGNHGAEWQVGELATKKVLFRATLKPVVNKEWRWQQPFAAISPDGKLVALPTENLDQVGLWDVAGKRLLRTLANKTARIKMLDHLAFSSDGKQVFAGGERIVYRWDVATGTVLPALEGNAGNGAPRTFTDDESKTLVTVDYSGMIRRWDPTTGKQLEAPHGYTPYTKTDLSWDGKHAVIADGGSRIDLWTLADYQRHELDATGSSTTRDVRFSRSGKLLAAGFSNGMVRIWDTATRQSIKDFQVNPKGEPSGVDGLEWSPDETCLYATTSLNGVLAWDWRNGNLRWRTPTPHATQVRASIDGKLVAVLRTDHREIQVLNSDTGNVRSTARMPPDKDRFFAPQCIVFSPDGRTILAGHYDGLLRLWDTATGNMRAAFPSDGDVVWGIDVSRDGRHAVTGSSNGTVRVWEMDTGTEVFRRVEPRSSSLRVTLSTDGRSVLSAQQRAPFLWSLVAESKRDREQHWSDLTSDPATAYRAQWGLTNSDGLAAFLRAKIGGRVPFSEAKRITQLIEDLDDRSFRARETALTELIRLGRVAEPAVRSALAKATSAEQKRRLESVVARFDKGLSPDELRMRRAVQALRWSNDSESVELLTEWASGMVGAPLTESAKTALDARKTVP